jgi:hypothetical protein
MVPASTTITSRHRACSCEAMSMPMAIFICLMPAQTTRRNFYSSWIPLPAVTHASVMVPSSQFMIAPRR